MLVQKYTACPTKSEEPEAWMQPIVTAYELHWQGMTGSNRDAKQGKPTITVATRGDPQEIH